MVYCGKQFLRFPPREPLQHGCYSSHLQARPCCCKTKGGFQNSHFFLNFCFYFVQILPIQDSSIRFNHFKLVNCKPTIGISFGVSKVSPPECFHLSYSDCHFLLMVNARSLRCLNTISFPQTSRQQPLSLVSICNSDLILTSPNSHWHSRHCWEGGSGKEEDYSFT